MHLGVALFCGLVAGALAGSPAGSIGSLEHLDKSGAQQTNSHPVDSQLIYNVPGVVDNHAEGAFKDELYSAHSPDRLSQSSDSTPGSGDAATAVASPEISRGADGTVEKASEALADPSSPFLYYPGSVYPPSSVPLPYHPASTYPYQIPYVIPGHHPFHPLSGAHPVGIYPHGFHPGSLFPELTYLPPLPPPPPGYPPLPPLPGHPQLPPSPRPLPPPRQPAPPRSPFPPPRLPSPQPPRLPPPKRPTLLPPPRTPSRPLPQLPPNPIPPPRRQPQPLPQPRPLPRPQPQPQPRPHPRPQPRPQPQPQPQPRPQPRPLPPPQPQPPQRPATQPVPVPIPDDGDDEIADPQSDPPVLSAENAPAQDTDEVFRRGFLPSPAGRRRLGDVKTSLEDLFDLNEQQPVNENPTFAYYIDQAPRV